MQFVSPIRVLGNPRRLCDGLTRREWLIAGAAAGLGLTSAVPAAETGSALPGRGRAKNVILLYLFGGPSHLDMLDMKPDAPAEVRGGFKPIRSKLPGCDVCEELPRLAGVLDRVTVVRSLTHPWNFHGMMWATTGIPEGSIPIEESQRNAAHWPYVGSVFDYFETRRRGPKPPGEVPDNIILPWPISSRRAAIPYARAHAAYLGNAHDPLWTEFEGQATRTAPRWHTAPREDVPDPHTSASPRMAASASLPRRSSPPTSHSTGSTAGARSWNSSTTPAGSSTPAPRPDGSTGSARSPTRCSARRSCRAPSTWGASRRSSARSTG
jgi:hypothetical protein